MSNYDKPIYLRYQIPKTEIFNLLKNKERIIFYIDVQSIAKGFYNKDNIFFEVNHFVNTKEPSNKLIVEMKNYLNNLYMLYKNYNPFFVLFYDDGRNEQNLSIDSSYKGTRTSIKSLITDLDEREIYKLIKKRYFTLLESEFSKENVSKIFYLHDLEADVVPYYCLKKELFGSAESTTLNIVLSADKDLLQCCKFKNTYQCTNRFFPSRDKGKQFQIDIWDDVTSLCYLDKDFKIGRLKSEYIPIILSIAGDTSDNVTGISGFKYKKAIKLIQNYQIPPTLTEILNNLNKMPEVIRTNIKRIEQNMKIIDFEEQLKRIGLLLDNYNKK